MRIEVGESDDGREIQMHVGDAICFELPENPTTGYRWSVGHPLPPELEAVRDDFVSRSSGIGAGGSRRLEFGARAQGRFRLELRHWRIWEGPATQLATLTISGMIL